MKKVVRAATNLYYDSNGRSKQFYLDFNNPAHLYDFFDETLGQDFTNQFKAEFDAWSETVIYDAEAAVEEISEQTEDYVSQIEFTVSEIRDIVNDLRSRLYDKAFSGGEVEELAGGVYDDVKRIGMFLDSIDRSIRAVYTKVLKMEPMNN